MSPSPEHDGDELLDAATAVPSNDFQASKKRRSNSEVTEYPRRRATIAVSHSFFSYRL